MSALAIASPSPPRKVIPLIQMLITCALAGLVIGAAMLRFSITYLRSWIPLPLISMMPFLTTVASLVCAGIWQVRRTKNPATLAFWQGLIRYGVAFDLAEFGWSKICHLQLVMPASKLDLPYRSFSSSDLFWYFFSHSYLFGCIIAGLQIAGAMLLLFRRTRLAGVFILLPVLANILLMDIFYEIGNSVVVHASIMMAGVLYFLYIEFDRLKEFFFDAKDRLPVMNLSKYSKWAIRLSIIVLPLLFILFRGPLDEHPELTGKYDVKQLTMDRRALYRGSCADSVLTVVYFDIRSGCVFEFNTPERRWNGTYTINDNVLDITWRNPADKPAFKGHISSTAGSRGLLLTGILGGDPMEIVLTPSVNVSPGRPQE
jgi:hypothetical protein